MLTYLYDIITVAISHTYDLMRHLYENDLKSHLYEITVQNLNKSRVVESNSTYAKRMGFVSAWYTENKHGV